MLVALVGLRTAATSIGLALRKAGREIAVVGHDPTASAALGPRGWGPWIA